MNWSWDTCLGTRVVFSMGHRCPAQPSAPVMDRRAKLDPAQRVSEFERGMIGSQIGVCTIPWLGREGGEPLATAGIAALRCVGAMAPQQLAKCRERASGSRQLVAHHPRLIVPEGRGRQRAGRHGRCGEGAWGHWNPGTLAAAFRRPASDEPMATAQLALGFRHERSITATTWTAEPREVCFPAGSPSHRSDR